MPEKYVLYQPEVKTLLEDEQKIISDIIESMTRLSGRTREKYGHNVRVSHAKSHGLAVGELTVMENLPEYLAQGLFTHGGTYPVIVRLANVPGEIVPDDVNTQRGFVFKILSVQGPKIVEDDEQHTQDFVLAEKNLLSLLPKEELKRLKQCKERGDLPEAKYNIMRRKILN